MKIILLLLCSLYMTSLSAQNKGQEIIISNPKPVRDTSEIIILRDKKSHAPKENSVSELFIAGKNAYRKGRAASRNQFRPFTGHRSGFNYGFVNFTNLPDAWKSLKLNWSHSFAMQFNLCKYSINLTPRNNFGMVTGLGLEYQRLRFDNDYVSIAKTTGGIEIQDIRHLYDNLFTVKRSSFKVLYLTIPLLAEVQFPASKNTKRMYVSGGFMGGVRMHSKTKIVYKDENGDKYKKKKKGDFNMVPFKVDVVGRIGYRNLNVWGSYTLTNMFSLDDGPGIHTYTVGLGLTF